MPISSVHEEVNNSVLMEAVIVFLEAAENIVGREMILVSSLFVIKTAKKFV